MKRMHSFDMKKKRKTHQKKKVIKTSTHMARIRSTWKVGHTRVSTHACAASNARVWRVRLENAAQQKERMIFRLRIQSVSGADDKIVHTHTQDLHFLKIACEINGSQSEMFPRPRTKNIFARLISSPCIFCSCTRSCVQRTTSRVIRPQASASPP